MSEAVEIKTAVCCLSCTYWTGLIQVDMEHGDKGISLVRRVCNYHNRPMGGNDRCDRYELLTPEQRLTGR